MNNFEQWKESLTIEEWAQKFVELDYCPKCPAYDFCKNCDILNPVQFDGSVNTSECNNTCRKRFIAWANEIHK